MVEKLTQGPGCVTVSIEGETCPVRRPEVVCHCAHALYFFALRI